jgi:hypothetical protein
MTDDTNEIKSPWVWRHEPNAHFRRYLGAPSCDLKA